MPKNVLYVVPSTGVGGAETFLLHTARYHQESEFHPIYACLRHGPLVERLQDMGHSVFVFGSEVRLRSPWSVWRAIHWLMKLMKKEKIHLVHSTMAYGAIFGAIAAFLKKTPHLWFQHGPVSGWQDRLAGMLPSYCILVNSRHTAEKQKSLGTKRPLASIRLGVAPDPMVNALDKEMVRKNLLAEFSAIHAEGVEFVSVMLCRPQPQKGVLLWLEAVALLRASGVKAGCVLVGENPHQAQYQHDTLALVRQKNIPFIWKTNISSPWHLIQAADALVCASIQPEGYGLTLAEANFYGVCAVAPREGGPLDLIQEGKTGLFFEPRNAFDLAKKLQRLANDPALKRSLCENASRAAAKDLLADGSIYQLEDKYRECLGAQ